MRLVWLLPIPYLLVLVVTSLQIWEIEEDHYKPETEVRLGINSVEQGIVPQYPNLFRVDIFLAKEQPQPQGMVNMRIVSALAPQSVLASGSAMATPYVLEGVYPFVFSPPINAVGQPLLISLTTTSDVEVITFGTITDNYLKGQLFTQNEIQISDLAFRLYYRPGITFTLKQTGWTETLSSFYLDDLYPAIKYFGLVPIAFIAMMLYFLVLFLLGWNLDRL